MNADRAMPGDAARPALPRRYIAAATIGNALEFYDFMTYAFFAIQIGHAFFPSDSAYASLMLSLATFGAGFVTRPLGGVIIGAYADRAGRRAAMMLSFTMMGCSILALALTPSYASIGIAAPVIALIARMVQGFSLGGEVGPTTAFLLEAAPENRRGRVVSWQGGSQYVATMTGGLVGIILATTLPPEALDAYGWRIAFLLGAVTLPFGLWIRRSLPETLHRPEKGAVAPAIAPGVLKTLTENSRVIILAVMVLCFGTIATYVTQYMATFAQNTLHMPSDIAFAATFVGNMGSFLGVLTGGWLSDHLGRKRAMIGPTVIFLLIVYPIFHLIVSTGSAPIMLGGMLIVGFFGVMGLGAFYPALTESLPKHIRGRAVATIYATSIAIFGGTAQLMVTWLIHTTGNPLAMVWYLMGATVIGLTAMILIVESAPGHASPPLGAAESMNSL